MPRPAHTAVDPHRLNVGAPGAAPAQAGNEGDLQHSDDAAIQFGEQQGLVRVAVDRIEGPDVRGIVTADAFPILAEFVVRQQFEQAWQVATLRATHREAIQRRFSHQSRFASGTNFRSSGPV